MIPTKTRQELYEAFLYLNDGKYRRSNLQVGMITKPDVSALYQDVLEIIDSMIDEVQADAAGPDRDVA